jgi:hypothetical protein
LTEVVRRLDVAVACDGVDEDTLRRDLDQGTARAGMMRGDRDNVDTSRAARTSSSQTDPTCTTRASSCTGDGDPGAGFPVVDSDEPSAFDALLQRAAQLNPA